MDRVLLVTGGSRGIGAATALAAADAGYAVCVNYANNAEAAEAVVDRIIGDGGKAIAVGADVSDDEAVRDMFGRIDRDLGRISALVNNAGVLEKQCRVEEVDTKRLVRVFAVNVFGAFHCAREAVLRMSTERGGAGGAIVNVSSVASRTGAAGEYVDYASSKGAVDAMTIGLAKEVAGQGVRVNAVRPAFIYTDIHASGGEPGRVDRIKGTIPMRRGGRPAEVASAILWLLSDEASYTTGSFIELAGGV